jgi:hypothetical protein
LDNLDKLAVYSFRGGGAVDIACREGAVVVGIVYFRYTVSTSRAFI